MRNGARIGVIAVAMGVAIAGRGCVTTPPLTSSLTSSEASTPPKGQNSDEHRAALDKQLNDSLGAFDAHLHEEQQKTAQERDARQATFAATTAGGAAGETPAGEAGFASSASQGSSAPAGASGAPGSSAPTGGSGAARSAGSPGSQGGTPTARGDSKASRPGDLKSEKIAGGTGGSASGNGATARVVPDGNDDDIIARRIRKAAELETDPELKDKLWKEYVEYKRNSQVR